MAVEAVASIHTVTDLTEEAQTAPVLPNTYFPPTVPDYSAYNEYTVSTGADLDTLLGGGTVVGSGPNNRITRPAILWLDKDLTYHYSQTGRGYRLSENTNYGADDWLIIATDDIDNLCAEGTRVQEGDTSLVKVTNNCQAYTFEIGERVTKVRFVGIDFSSDQTASNANAGVILCGQYYTGSIDLDSDADHATDIIFDRCYIHGPTGSETNWNKGQYYGIVFVGGTRIALIESCVDHIRTFNAGTQQNYCVYCQSLTKQLTIWNNRISCKGWPIFFGGAENPNYEENIRDVDIRYNLLDLDPYFDSTQGEYNGYSDGGKFAEVIEIKHAERMLIEKNRFSHLVVDPRTDLHPYGVILKCANQDGNMTWVFTRDITVRWNDLRGMNAGWAIGPASDVDKETADYGWVKLENNLFVAPANADDPPTIFPRNAIAGASRDDGWNSDLHLIPHDIIVCNNTSIGHVNYDSVNSSRLHLLLSGDTGNAKIIRLTYENNICDSGLYGTFGSGYGSGNASLNAYTEATGRTWSTFCYGPRSGTHEPTGTTQEDSIDDVGFAQWASMTGSWKVTGTYSGYGVDYDTLQSNLAIADSGVRF